MTQAQLLGRPLRVAIIGSGPAAFYAADHLLQQIGVAIEVDMHERLATPFGLVRFGVAPDHLKIKTVTRAFTATARDPRFAFYGGVEYGRDLSLDDLRAHYDQVLFATGAQTDRRMGIPGEDLEGSHPATEFVAWYNGHPDFRDCAFDLSSERALIVGVGNVAIDVARILSLSPSELDKSDMPAYAVDALSRSRVREVFLVGRRGPAQAAFTNPELKEIGNLEDADVIVRPEEAALDAESRLDLERGNDRALARKVALIEEYAARTVGAKPRRLHLRFLLGPAELIGDPAGHVRGARLLRNRLVRNDAGTLNAEATGDEETIDAGLVFRSVGYRGVALPGLPFNDRWGVIFNQGGRVADPESHEPLPGLYTSGWIKRGPSGVIGTNKPDSVETATAMLEDAAQGRCFAPIAPARHALEALLAARGVDWFTFADWERLDVLEREAGERQGRPRLKFTSAAEMRAALACTDQPPGK